MIEERRSLIEVGDVLTNVVGAVMEVTSVEKGRHGTLVRGEFPNSDGWAFLPWELPPIEGQEYNWYKWPTRSTFTLENGLRLGLVNFNRDHIPITIEEHDSHWERTIAAIRAEETGDESDL